MSDKIVISEAEGFYIKPEHVEKMIALLESGVFDIESGKAEINIHNGQFQSVYLNTRTYKRES